MKNCVVCLFIHGVCGAAYAMGNFNSIFKRPIFHFNTIYLYNETNYFILIVILSMKKLIHLIQFDSSGLRDSRRPKFSLFNLMNIREQRNQN